MHANGTSTYTLANHWVTKVAVIRNIDIIVDNKGFNIV